MSGICALCGNNSELKNSHIIPSFIFRWMKKTGAGRLRNVSNPNKIEQDGIKTKLLCNECEGRFSISETKMSTNIFYPVVDDNVHSFQYDSTFYYFTVSIFWRVLKNFLLEEHKDTVWYNELLFAEQEWKNYLLNQVPIQKNNEFHLFIGANLTEECSDETYIRYMARNVDASIPHNDDICFFFIKIPRFIFILPIEGINKEDFKNSIINPSGGVFDIKSVEISESIIGQTIIERAEEFSQIQDRMSSIQINKMKENTKKYQDNDIQRVLRYFSEK
ncbi:hypothetical protein H9Y05_15665 [Crocinitomicaceae bacterium CZZ-1]|uniref:HNH endonuclease n=1 Tax=Taishania pollutisoli TaxID=2766479 RepID=A0A8J6TU44_9FLAO|nr:hypothetical protein [Taishania pollutisoli]MBC9813914.1 hypothetical protein [Taishania pollutisoli]